MEDRPVYLEQNPHRRHTRRAQDHGSKKRLLKRTRDRLPSLVIMTLLVRNSHTLPVSRRPRPNRQLGLLPYGTLGFRAYDRKTKITAMIPMYNPAAISNGVDELPVQSRPAPARGGAIAIAT